MRRTVLVVALVLVLGPALTFAGIQYYVRQNGDNFACNGRTNANYDPLAIPPDPNCAFQTPQMAIDTMLPGDDVQIATGTYARFVLNKDPVGFNAPDTDPTLIAGDPAVARTEIVIDGTGFEEAIYSKGGNPPSVPRTRNVTVRHLSFRAGTYCFVPGDPNNTSHGCTGIFFDGQNERLTFEDLEADPNQLTGLAPRHPSPAIKAGAVIKVGESTYQSSNIVFRNSRFIGKADTCLYGICGLDANIFFTFAGTVKVQNVQASYFHGSFIQEAGSRYQNSIYIPGSNGIIENCTITDSTCQAGDGCVYSYNDEEYVVRRNVFDRVRGNSLFAVIGVRRNPNSTHIGGVLAYNNTLILVNDLAYQDVAMGWRQNTADSGPSGNSVFLNNIVMNAASDAVGTYAVRLSQCPASGYSVNVDHNDYWNNDQNRNFGNVPGCPGTFDANSIINNPQLGSSGVVYTPPFGNAACLGGTTSFQAPDGDWSSGYMGAKHCTGEGGGDPGCRPVCYD